MNNQYQYEEVELVEIFFGYVSKDSSKDGGKDGGNDCINRQSTPDGSRGVEYLL